MQEAETESLAGTPVSAGSVNDELLSACAAYCNHVYTSATGCALETLEAESAGCQSFCSVLSQSVPDQCESLLIIRYQCVIENDLVYSCTTEDDSPQAADDTCLEDFDRADACLDSLRM